jgi:hypothetical protein
MDASTLPKGQSLEKTDGRPVNEPGKYKHKPTGAIFITAPGEEGVVQADALSNPDVWHFEWERVGDVPSRTELLEMRKEQEAVLEAPKKAEAKADKLPEGGETYDPKAK